jgi:hypothetical protein
MHCEVSQAAHDLPYSLAPELSSPMQLRALALPSLMNGEDEVSLTDSEDKVRLPTNTADQVTYAQLHSPFCTKVLADLRLMIYHHMVGGLREKRDFMRMALDEEWREFSRCRKPVEGGGPCNWRDNSAGN